MTNPSRFEVWKMFDRISPTYDKINRILSLGMDRSWRKKALKHLPVVKKDLRVLDLATGTGDQLIALFEGVEGGASIGSAVGIDLSEEMLLLAKKKIGSKTYSGKIEFLRADAEKLPFENHQFDAATFSFGIRNVPDPLVSLKEIYRVLKPEGRCLILEFSLPRPFIRKFYLFYLRRILPKIGGLLSREPAAYRYLNETIETFPSGNDFLALMKKASFASLKAVPMAFGGVTLYVGEKECLSTEEKICLSSGEKK